MQRAWVCFSDYPEEPISPELPLDRNGAVTFGTMNAPYKFTPAMIALWARVMNAVPGSRFLIVRPEIGSIVMQTNIAKEFGKHGIAPDRLYFLINPNGQFNHLRYYNEIDIALDAYPVVGGTTSLDTMWMGVPVVGKYGPNLHQRQNFAQMNHIGFPEFAVTSDDDFFELAVELADDAARLHQLRHALRPAIKASPLYDAAGFVEDFQDRMMELVERHGLR
jgi:predicted O-linked N-acetylglucosamine transferase (SPINDLY family)